MASNRSSPESGKLDKLVAEARRKREQREKTYREQALRIHPWICARCAREFTHTNVHLLTVHHKDHNHDNNPPDGSNWELLCNYCHENEHSRVLDNAGRSAAAADQPQASYKPFANLKDLLKGKQ
ncbi:MAG: HNH nuclease family protein [Betaproteobacteria bacterium]|nr:HNH nuclease family protein [Betaproteobacteria bacterium]